MQKTVIQKLVQEKLMAWKRLLLHASQRSAAIGQYRKTLANTIGSKPEHIIQIQYTGLRRGNTIHWYKQKIGILE
jgi:hypothetical protein